MISKQSLRKRFLAQRKQSKAHLCHSKSVVIQHKVIAAIKEQKHQRIALYSPIHQEVETNMIINYLWQQDIEAYLPKVLHNTLVFSHFTPQSKLVKNRWQGLEVDSEKHILTQDLDCLICPMIVFNSHRYRIGYGGGFYDQSLHNSGVFSWGMAYDWQQNNDWVSDAHDQKLEKIFTEKTTY